MELFIYNLVKGRPWLKDLIKKVYQYIFSIFGRYLEFGDEKLILRENSFFGFHDKSPWSNDNSMLLAHQFKGIGNEDESALNPVDIVIFEGQTWEQKRVVASSCAWNWQQGSQLQWKGGNLIYNNFVDGFCKAVELDSQGDLVKVHSYPIGAVSQCGTLMAGFCYKSFGEAMSGYGYDFEGAKAESNIDIDKLLIFSDERVITEINGEDISPGFFDEIEHCNPFVSHALFSRSGRYLAFMRRLAVPGRRLKSALYVYDLNTSDIVRVPFKNMVSHYCWLHDDKIFAFADTDLGDGYYVYSMTDSTIESFTKDLGVRDGHPHACDSTECVVLDGYPDKYRLQPLSIYDFQQSKRTIIARLYSPMKFWSNKRVDLHPRLRSDGKYVAIDCSTTGVRSLATLRLPN